MLAMQFGDDLDHGPLAPVAEEQPESARLRLIPHLGNDSADPACLKQPVAVALTRTRTPPCSTHAKTGAKDRARPRRAARPAGSTATTPGA